MSKNILEEAIEVTSGSRQDDYGNPRDSFEKIAELWTAVLKHVITAEDVALCMICTKIARQMHKPKRDNLVDIAGYARTIEMMDDMDKAIAEKCYRHEFKTELRSVDELREAMHRDFSDRMEEAVKAELIK